MINALKKLFAIPPSPDYRKIMNDGGIILDVRSVYEFSRGHIKGALNIPVDQLSDNLRDIPLDTVIITCCATSMRSATARRILLANGFTRYTTVADGQVCKTKSDIYGRASLSRQYCLERGSKGHYVFAGIECSAEFRRMYRSSHAA